MSNFLDKISDEIVAKIPLKVIIGSTVYYKTRGGTSQGEVVQFDKSGTQVLVRSLNSEYPMNIILHEGGAFWTQASKIFLTVGELEESLGHKEEKVASKKSDYLSGVVQKKAWYFSPDEDYFEDLTDKNIYHKAISFLHEFLSNYDLNGRASIKFDNLKNASFKEGGKVTKGDVNTTLQIKTISGVKLNAEIVIPVREGKLIEPSIIFLDGNPRIIAQTTFDEIVKSGTFKRKFNRDPEDILSPELIQMYQEQEYPLVQFGVFGRE